MNTDWDPHMTDIRSRMDRRRNRSRLFPKRRDSDDMLSGSAFPGSDPASPESRLSLQLKL